MQETKDSSRGRSFQTSIPYTVVRHKGVVMNNVLGILRVDGPVLAKEGKEWVIKSWVLEDDRYIYRKLSQDEIDAYIKAMSYPFH